jgi:integrase
LYRAITTLYAEDAYYRTLFLFALHGRRWNEIKTLTWECINLNKDTYTILAKHNKIGEDQEYALSPIVKASLIQIQDDRTELVFKPHRGGKELYPPKKQLEKLKKATGIDELTMHYFRHILVTAMGEEGTTSTIMSAALGHTDSRTLEKHYLSFDNIKATGSVNTKVENILEASIISHNNDEDNQKY